MIRLLEDAALANSLDAQFQNILNVGTLEPAPANLVTSDDARLDDVREPIPGSVTNASVAPSAAIDQSKINLNGQIPTAWLGTASTQAARGDLVEYIANKNQPNGYAGLDGTGKIPSANLPDGVGLATVTSVGISLPPELQLSPGDPNPITVSGTWNIRWVPLAGPAWFGRIASGSGDPTFQYGAIPTALIPDLDASQVVSGEFAPLRLPLAIHGTGHAKGAAPDPGTGTATDYLARDMTYKTAPTVAVTYQPTLSTPTINHTNEGTGDQTITPSSIDPGVTFFYSNTVTGVAPFFEFPEVGYIALPDATHIWVYAARPGWNNSAMATYLNP